MPGFTGSSKAYQWTLATDSLDRTSSTIDAWLRNSGTMASGLPSMLFV